jgi:hypothetical protein
MANIHIISDLNLGFHEHTNPEDEVIPADCDLLVVNGNVATSPKRSMLFVETLCNKYPDIPVIYNLGMYECGHHDKSQGKNNFIDGIQTRQKYSPDWPKNLHFPRLSSVKINIGDQKYDIMCAFGFPKIIKPGVWEDSFWYKNISFGMTEDHSLFRPAGAADVYHGFFPTKATVEEINQHHDQEQEIIRAWELDWYQDQNCGYKILVTALSPIQDPFCQGLGYIMYPKFHLNNRLWITSGVKFSGSIVRGAKLFSNPGSGAQARQQLVTV